MPLQELVRINARLLQVEREMDEILCSFSDKHESTDRLKYNRLRVLSAIQIRQLNFKMELLAKGEDDEDQESGGFDEGP